jgi:hypothetical protein
MSGTHQSAVSNLRLLFGIAHHYLEGTLMGLTNAQANWLPEGRPASIIGQYAHIVTGEDWLINVKAKGAAPLMATSHAGRTGFVEPPPIIGWNNWAQETSIDLPALRDYAQAVYQATDAYLASISDEELNRPVDMSEVGLGQQTVASAIGLALLNGALHCGEIACLKGLQGLVGYPEAKPETQAIPA